MSAAEYFRARYYDPSVVNKYAYGAKAPKVYTDPAGKFLFILFLVAFGEAVLVGAVVGALAGGVIAGLANVQHGNFWTSLLIIYKAFSFR